MTVNKQKNGKFLCHINKKGIKRVRKTFDTRDEAEIFEREVLFSHQKQVLVSGSDDKRKLSELVSIWFKYHGINLADSVRRRSCLDALAIGLDDVQGCQLTPEQFVNFRFDRLSKGLMAKTFNNHHSYLSAMFNKLRKLKVIDYDNPLNEIDYIKIQERQLSYLSKDQIEVLLDEILAKTVNESTWYVTQICLRTGARWGEAEQLTKKQIRNELITYEFTKSKKTRSIPIDSDFFKDLAIFSKDKNPNDRVFTNCIGAFRRAIIRAEIDLPKGQNTHILRHSFASHFMLNGGNILILKEILGHADISMTMKYAHLSPGHLEEAIKLNPLTE